MPDRTPRPQKVHPAPYLSIARRKLRSQIAAHRIRYTPPSEGGTPQIGDADLGQISVRGFDIDLLVLDLRRQVMEIGADDAGRLDSVMKGARAVVACAFVRFGVDAVALVLRARGSRSRSTSRRSNVRRPSTWCSAATPPSESASKLCSQPTRTAAAAVRSRERGPVGADGDAVVGVSSGGGKSASAQARCLPSGDDTAITLIAAASECSWCMVEFVPNGSAAPALATGRNATV